MVSSLIQEMVSLWPKIKVPLLQERITRLKVVIKEASDQELGLWLFELGT